MKFGFRKPSFKQSISAATKGSLNRAIKKEIIPGYGEKGIGIANPKKYAYNKLYNITTVDTASLLTHKKNSLSDSSKYSDDNSSQTQISNQIELIEMLVICILLLILGIYWLANDWYFIFIGVVILLFGILGTTFIIIELFRPNKVQFYKKITIQIPPLKEIDSEFSEKLLSNFALECYFHFRRPLLSIEDYNNTKFSITFRKAFYLYEDYKKEWNVVFRNYTFEMKVHQLLIQLLDEDFIDINYDETLEAAFYQTLQNRLMQSLSQEENMMKNGYTMRTFLNWYIYKNLWMTNKYEPELIKEKLSEDLLRRQKGCIHNTLVWYGGLNLWNYSIPQIVKEYESR